MATVEKQPRNSGVSDVGELLDRQPPRSIEAERAVLGSLLLLPEVYDEIALLICPDDFYDGAHRSIFTQMKALHDSGQQIEPTLLSQLLRDAGQYESIGGAAFLLELGHEVATAAHAEYYARIIRDKALLRSLIHASTDLIQEAYATGVNARDMLTRAEQRIFRIRDSKAETQTSDIRDILLDCFKRIDARRDNEHADGGIETGFMDYDDLTGGLQNSELTILAARPSMGKTALALNLVEHISVELQKHVLMVSLEMAAMELGNRLLCARARVNGLKVRTGHFSEQEHQDLLKAASDYYSAKLVVDDTPGRNMTEIAATARRLKRNGTLDLIVIDYLQLIEPDNPRDSRQEQVSRISRRLKGLARELSVPVVCLAQVNRQVESTRDNKPQLSHLRESGAIEQDADVVAFIHREEYYQNSEADREQVKGQAELMIRKQRNGPTGDVKLTWLHEFGRFENFQQPEYGEFQDFGIQASDD